MALTDTVQRNAVQDRPVTSDGLRWVLTNHALDRLASRFPRLFSGFAIEQWQHGRSRYLIAEAFELADQADERRQIINDTRLMAFIHETYGFNKRFRFFVAGDVLFLGVENHDTAGLIIVTVMDLSKGKTFNHQALGTRHKFGRA